MTDNDAVQNDDGGETDDVNTRWWGTNDVLAGAWTAFAIVASVGFAVQGIHLPQWLQLVDVLGATTSIVWAFGGGAFGKAMEAVQGGGN